MKKSIKITGIHTITIQVKNFKNSLVFYRDKLGIVFEKMDEKHGVAWAKYKGTNFIIHKIFDSKVKKLKGRGITIHFQVPDVDKYYEHLQAKGVKLSSKPANKRWGVREFEVTDPDGYDIEIVGPLTQD